MHVDMDVYSAGVLDKAISSVPLATVVMTTPLLLVISKAYVTVAAPFALMYMTRRQGPPVYALVEVYCGPHTHVSAEPSGYLPDCFMVG